MDLDKLFIGISRYNIKKLYNMLQNDNFLIMLLDKDNNVIFNYGNEDLFEHIINKDDLDNYQLRNDNLVFKTNETSITNNKPVQLEGRERIFKSKISLTCSVVPIHDDEGNVIRTLNMIGPSSYVSAQTLSLLITTLTIIKNEVQNRIIADMCRQTTGNLDAIINSLSYSLLTADNNGIITRVNTVLCTNFGVTKKQMVGQRVSYYLNKWDEYWYKLNIKRQKILDTEVSLKNIVNKGRYIMNASPINPDNDNIDGVVFSFRNMKQVYKMVNKYVGLSAYFSFDDILGESVAIRTAINIAKQVANSPSTILITGESGTGKEVFAQAIHKASSRSDAGFIAVNCGAIPEPLFESELFGYEEGAFTDAKKGGRPGKFELANGGTLFLDEVGDMPLDMQVKLLRTLQEGSVTRVGGTTPIPLDVRIIAATNKNLKEKVEQKKFRLDLYYRLSVIPLRIPPLRERKEDIPKLIDFFLDEKAAKLEKNIPNISEDIYNFLINYEWPGNVRELENFIEKTVNLDGKVLLDDNLNRISKAIEIKDETGEFTNKYCIDSIDSLENIEKNAIKRTLDFYKRNMTQAAKALGISRNTLYLKCKKYSI